ncbi:GNAT family N-acetyltransferase [Pseudorhodoferax sp. Leaf274]|uniref:GNAT family N-acetyltransferase n=1 Tax=Pseudorhodoferax sp. Leaf274 TaxID=1736318 RepID=UPI00070355E2|nr:GNAT family N-acetyltransferase [Pseudorhodoferax sp. Leaf274]KQP49231.1 hypothetical protein ASF44_01005 [Pseudorhodoferax sp. Leaf274]
MHFEIQPATLQHASAICDVLRASITFCCTADHRDDPETVARWLANKTVAQVEKWIAASDSVAVVASRAHDVLGVALVSGNTLALCYVVPRALHQGVGKALLRAAQAGASARGVEVLQLDSTRTALPFYSRNGFSACGPLQRWAGLECQPMRKSLVADVSPPDTVGDAR